MIEELPGFEDLPSEQKQMVRLERIFMPHYSKQREAVYRNRLRYVHYTSAEAALSIIRTKRLWMRNTNVMADFREVQHGFEMLRDWFANPTKKKAFDDALDAVLPSAGQEAINFFNQWWNDIRFNTYIASISEHSSDEDRHGRLSMWRSFGGNNARVAMVFDIPFFSGAAIAMNVLFSPVAYLTEQQVDEVIASVLENVRSEHEFLKSVGRPAIVGTIFSMLLAGVTCLKHEGFHEEREWRVIYAPQRNPSPLIQGSIMTIGGVPQNIYEFPLDERVDRALVDIDAAKMFDRLIIGPSQYPLVMYSAFVAALEEMGVADAKDRVRASQIPLRS